MQHLSRAHKGFFLGGNYDLCILFVSLIFSGGNSVFKSCTCKDLLCCFAYRL